LIYTTVRLNDNVIVSLNTDCANVHTGPSVSDPIIKCEPSGTPGFISFGSSPDEHGSSNLLFWYVSFSDGVTGWTAGTYLTHPIPVIRSLAVVGTNLLAGTGDGGGAYRSTNNGTSWTDINVGLGLSLDNGTVHVNTLAVTGTNIFAGTDVLAYLSTNAGTSWSTLPPTGLPGYGLPSLLASRTCLFAKTYSTDTFNFRLINNSASWEPITCPGELALIDTNLFAEHSNGDIDLSTDNGTTWKKVFSGGLAEQSWNFCASGNYLFNVNSGTDPYDCVARMLWNGSCITSAPAMNFPPNYVPCSKGVGSLYASGTNVFLNYGDIFFSTNSGTDWKAVNWPFNVPAFANPGPFVTLGTNLFVGGTGVWRNSLPNALPIQLASVKVTGTTMTWSTVSETRNYGFYVQRDAVDIAFIAGHGTTLQQHTYSYTDHPLPGQYQYRLKQVDLDGTTTFSEGITVVVSAPREFTLAQNYPNPFNPSTKISFTLTKEGPVSLRVYDILGREVSTLVNEYRKPGQYTETFNGNQMSSGVYVCVLSSSEGRLTAQMMLLK
jgi:hypothetical protein